MIKFKIGNRLNLLAKLSNGYTNMADIGTDHGYLPYYLFEQNSIKEAILCDINSGPLENAKKTFLGSTFMGTVDFRLGSGIEPLNKNEVEHVVIAGMGGGLIIDILSTDYAKTKTFDSLLLQPMTEQNALRKWLMENEFSPFTDYFTSEGNKYYEIIHFNKMNDVSAINVYRHANDLEFGYMIALNNLTEYMAFLKHKQRKYELIFQRASNYEDKKKLCTEKLSTLNIIFNLIRSEYSDYIR